MKIISLILVIVLYQSLSVTANSKFFSQVPKDFTYPESPSITEIASPFYIKSVSGIVTEPQGARLPKVLVEQVALDRKTRINATFTNDKGLFSFRNLPLGKYFLKFSLPGFDTVWITVIKTTKSSRTLKVELDFST